MAFQPTAEFSTVSAQVLTPRRGFLRTPQPAGRTTNKVVGVPQSPGNIVLRRSIFNAISNPLRAMKLVMEGKCSDHGATSLQSLGIRPLPQWAGRKRARSHLLATAAGRKQSAVGRKRFRSRLEMNPQSAGCLLRSRLAPVRSRVEYFPQPAGKKQRLSLAQ